MLPGSAGAEHHRYLQAATGLRPGRQGGGQVAVSGPGIVAGLKVVVAQ